MTPANIIGMSLLKNLDIIAITDHNSCKNCPAVMSLAQQNNIIAIPGMELCTVEEVHVLCLFATLMDAMHFDAFVSTKLIQIPNNETIFGKQEIYDANDCIIGNEPYLLINATEISFDHLSSILKEYHGIYIPAHVDKGTNSLISNLGFVPPDSSFRCVEFSDSNKIEELCKVHPYFKQCNIITDSDAHSLGNIHEPTNFIDTSSREIKDILMAIENNLS